MPYAVREICVKQHLHRIGIDIAKKHQSLRAQIRLLTRIQQCTRLQNELISRKVLAFQKDQLILVTVVQWSLCICHYAEMQCLDPDGTGIAAIVRGR